MLVKTVPTMSGAEGGGMELDEGSFEKASSPIYLIQKYFEVDELPAESPGDY